MSIIDDGRYEGYAGKDYPLAHIATPSGDAEMTMYVDVKVVIEGFEHDGKRFKHSYGSLKEGRDAWSESVQFYFAERIEQQKETRDG